MTFFLKTLIKFSNYQEFTDHTTLEFGSQEATGKEVVVKTPTLFTQFGCIYSQIKAESLPMEILGIL